MLTAHIADVLAADETDSRTYLGWHLDASGLLATAPATQIDIQFPGAAFPAYLAVP